MASAELVKSEKSSTDSLAKSELATSMVAARSEAEVKARYLMAERHPRDLDLVRQKLLQECKRPGFAMVARYLKPVGKGVEGPSIRFAEAAIRVMGNIDVAQDTIYDDEEKRIVRVTVTDCESNTAYTTPVTLQKTVERRTVKDGDEVARTRTNKKGDLVYIILATEDDLLNKQSALISKAIRTNALRLVPGDIIDECMMQVIVTQKNEDAVDPESNKRKIFDSFAEYGVNAYELKQYLGHDAAKLTPKELSDLRALYSAIKDGETTWKQVVEAREQPTQKNLSLDEVKEKLKAKK